MTIDVLSPDLKKHATPRQCEYIDAVLKYGSNTKAADAMGVGRRTVDRAISAAKNAAVEAGVIISHGDEPRVLVLDIETAPILAHIWDLWQMPMNIDKILSDWYVMSWSAKWLGEREVMGNALNLTKGYTPGCENDRALITELWILLNTADYVIAHNGDKFDIKKMNTRFLEHRLPPTTPYKSIDTLKIAKRTFSFTSNKLDWLAQKLLGKKKLVHEGLPLWQKCITGDSAAWAHMLKYNKRDVTILEEVYMKLRAWDHLHPSFAVHTNKDVLSCTVCGSENVKPTGQTVKTTTQAYLGYECNDCGHQMRGRTNIRKYSQTQATLVNAR